MMSAQPAVVSRHGASAIRVVSATTASGGSAATEWRVSPSGIEERPETIPSWEATVGTETKPTPRWSAAIFAMSIGFPPPKAIR